MKKEVLLILNPHAGKGSAKNKLFSIVDHLVKHDFEVCVYTTQYAGHASEIVQSVAGKYDLLISCGGDGTLNEIVNALMQNDLKMPFGYIPMGTTNDFATTLNIPKNINKAIENIVSGHVFQSDIGRFNDHYFAYVAAFGAFTEVSYSTPQQYKNIFGKAAYFLEGLMQLPKIKTYHLTIEYDGNHVEDDYIFGAISNSKSIGGLQSYSTKNAELDDGVFEAFLVRCPQNPLDFQIIITALLRQELNDKFMTFFKASSVKIKSEQKIAWTLDGESGGEHDHVDVRLFPKAFSIIVP